MDEAPRDAQVTPDAAEPAQRRRGRRTLLIAAAVAVVLAAGIGIGVAASGSSSSPVPVAAAVPASTSAAPSVAATAPAADECTRFAQVYNGQVGPVLKAPGGGDVYLTQLTDAFTALAATVSGATDPYSQTIAADADAVAAAPTSYAAMGTFNTDLADFLTSCGMSGS